MKTIFRKWNDSKSIIALFPDEQWNKDRRSEKNVCSSYEHIGQHGPADYNYVMLKSKRASPKEFKMLQKELENLGYNLNIRMRK